VNREALAEWRDEGSPEAQIFLHLVERETCRIMLEDSLYELHVAQPGSEKEKATETARRAGAAYDGIKDIYIPHIFKGFPGGIAQTATGGEGHEEGSQASPSERTRKVVQITGVGQRLIIGGVATVDILRDQGLLRFEISAPRGKGVKAYGSELAAEGDLCWTNKAGPDEAQDRYEISQRKGDYLIVRTPGGDTKISFLTRKQIGRSGSRVLVETPRNVDYSFEKIGPAGGNAATSSEGMLGKHRSPRGVHDGITARLRKLLDDKEFVTSRGLNSESVARFKRWYDEIRTENEFDVPDDYKLPIEQLGTYDEDVGLWTVELPVGTLAVVGGESITGHLGFTTGKERGLQGVRWIAVGSKKSPRKLKEDEKQAGLTIEDAIEMDEMHEEAHYGFANDGLYLETRLKYIMGDSYVQEVAELVNPNGTVNIIKFAEWHDRASPQTQLYYYVSHAHAWRKIVNQCIDNGGRAPKRNYKRMAKLAMTRYDNAIKEYRAATRELADASPTTGPRFAGGNPAVSSGMPVENERPLSAAGQPLKLKPHQEYANSCMKAVSDSVKSEEDVLLLVVDSRIGHLGSYGHLLIKSLKEDTITQIRKMGYKGKVEVFVHEDSETITSKIETFSEEHRDNKNAIVRGIVWNEKVDSYSRLKGLKERVSLVAVDDSRFESNRNEENLRYFSIFPLIETSFTGQLMRHEYMSSQPGEADSVITSIVTLDIPPAERINPAELDELLEEDAAFWGSA